MKILFHAINGIGLGHVVRTLEIAKAIRAQHADAELVFVTNSVYPDPIIDAGFKVYRLQSMNEADRQTSYSEYLRANYLKIVAIIRKEHPDAVLMDSEFNDPLVEFCSKNKVKTCFVLRRTTDEQFGHLCQKSFWNKVDLVLVPHTKDDLDPAQRNVLSKHKNVHFVGPILREFMDSNSPECHARECGHPDESILDSHIRGGDIASLELNSKTNQLPNDEILRILITFAAGSDIPSNNEMFSKVSVFLGRLRKEGMRIGEKQIDISIVTGPLFNPKACDLHGFKYTKFEYDLPAIMLKSDVVISPAGYNLVNEIIATKTPALLIPVIRKEDDQYVRAKSLEDKGCAQIVREEIWESLECSIEQDKFSDMRLAFPQIGSGNAQAAQQIRELIQEKTNVLYLRALWLPFSERFIYDEVSSIKSYQANVLCLQQTNQFDNPFEVLSDARFSCLWNPDYPYVPETMRQLHDQLIQWAFSQIKARDIQLLHAQFLSDAVFFLELKKLSGLPLIVSVRGHDLYSKVRPDLTALFAVADMFLVRSGLMKEDLLRLGCPTHKITVQHSAIRLPQKKSIKKSQSKEVRILMVGRLVEKKGTLLGLKIFNRLCEEFDNLKLYIVGNGPLRNDVLSAVEQSPCADRIKLCGELPNDKVRELMDQCHILLQPSLRASNGDREGIPGVIMEAMAHELIVVASDHGSIPEIVKHKTTGYLFEENNIEDAVNKSSLAIKNLSRLDDMRKKALEKVTAEFNIAIETAKLEVIYDAVIKTRETAGSKYEKFYSNYRAMTDTGRPAFFRADIHPVRGCNSYCVMCDHWKQKKQEFLSKQQIFDTIKELHSIGTKEIRFHGHEPTLRSDLLELIDYAKSLGIWVGLKTNCVDLNREYCRRLSRLDKLYVSIDSPVVAMHNKMRGNSGSFKDNLKVISWVKAENPSVILESNSVVTRLNYHTLGEMPQFAHRIGVSKVSFVLLNTKNKREITNLLPKPDQMREFYLKIVPEIISGCITHGIAFDFSPFFADLVLEDPHKMLFELKNHPEKFEEEINNFVLMQYGKTFYERFGCHGPVDHLSINYDGNVYPCCVVERVEANAMGNLAASSFKAVWNTEKYRSFRDKTIKSGGTCCQHYATCASNFGSRKYLAQKISTTQTLNEVVHER